MSYNSNMSDMSDKSDNKHERNRRLQERLIRFAQSVVSFCQKLPKTPVNQRLVPQLAASANSTSANYAETCAAGSKADFLNKLRIVLKEACESRSHLRVIYTANKSYSQEIVSLGKESVELIKIFRTVLSKF